MKHIARPVFVVGFFLFLNTALTAGRAVAGEQWVASWAAPPDSAGPPLAEQTVRQIVRLSIGGASVRVRLSNLLGVGPVTIGPVHVARVRPARISSREPIAL